MEAIILAGGFGTRLRSMVTDVPKPMAPINNKPFLEYLLNYLNKNGFKRIVLAVGYKWEVIFEHFGKKYKNMEVVYSTENEPLGTGGALKKAINMCKQKDVFVFNGDTFFEIDAKTLYNFHIDKKAYISIAGKGLTDFDRYGTMHMDENNQVISFEEKKKVEKGIINGGIYILNKNLFNGISQTKFSFEKDVLNNLIKQNKMYAKVFDNYFIDIGIPEDYVKAQQRFN